MRARFLLLVAPLVGCYSFRDTPSGVRPPVGPIVRLQLTDEGRVAVKPMAGPGVDQLQGVMASSDTGAYVVHVTSVRRDGNDEHWTGETLTIPAVDVARVSVRRFDAFKTTVASGALIAAGALIRFGSSDTFASARGGGTSGAGR